MKVCQYCNAKFASLAAWQIHLGIGAPAFHTCNNPAEMEAKGMSLVAGSWTIPEDLITRQDGWATLKRDIKQA